MTPPDEELRQGIDHLLKAAAGMAREIKRGADSGGMGQWVGVAGKELARAANAVASTVAVSVASSVAERLGDNGANVESHHGDWRGDAMDDSIVDPSDDLSGDPNPASRSEAVGAAHAGDFDGLEDLGKGER